MIEKVQLILTGFLVILSFPVIGYFLHREFTRKDTNEQAQRTAETRFQEHLDAMATELHSAMSELTQAMGALRLSMEETRRWSIERFVSHESHTKSVADIYTNMAAQKEFFEKSLEWCSKNCRMKTGAVPFGGDK